MVPVGGEVSIGIKRKISKNIYYIIELFISSCEGLDWDTFLEEIFPLFYFRKNPERCKEIVIELYEMTKDEFQRNYLKPIYEYALYHLIQWWLDVTDIDMDEKILPEEISSEDDRFWAENINNIERYSEYLFDDWDFLDVAEIWENYKIAPRFVTEFLRINLDDYIELMPDDIKEEYQKLKCGNGYQNQSLVIDNDIEEFVVKKIYNVLKQLENRPREIIKWSEVELSNQIHIALNEIFMEHGIKIVREELAGYAEKNTGELDFYGYRIKDGVYENLFVGENKKWGQFESSLKQLIGYMDYNYSFGFTIIFNKTTNLNTILKGRKELLDNFEIDGYFKSKCNPTEVTNMYDVLVTKYENPEKKGTYFNVYHFIINAFKPERELAAKEARNKKVI